MSRLEQIKEKMTDLLAEQAWFQSLKSKYDELDPKSRMMIQAGGALSVILAFFLFGLSLSLRASAFRAEFEEKQELLSLLKTSNEELKRLRSEESQLSRSGSGTDGAAPWQSYLETIASSAGIPKENLSILSEKPGTKTERSQETLIELQLKKVNIKRATRLAYFIENGSRPLKLRHLTLDTAGDSTGYLDATLSLSGFAIKAESEKN